MNSAAVIAGTLDLKTAAAQVWDVAVVGAGPAGALASREAARLGASVLLVDKATFPRWKVCGCCVNAAALSVLEAVGLEGLPQRCRAVPLHRIRLAAGGRCAECFLPGGVSVSRETFDSALVRAAIGAGAHFCPQADATLVADSAAPYRRLQLRAEGATVAVQARMILAADGLSSRLAHAESESDIRIAPSSRVGAGAVLDEGPSFYTSGTVFMASARGGYVGLVRLEDGRLDVAAALDRDAVRQQGGPAPLAAAVLREAGFPVPASLEEASWRGTPPLTRRTARAYGPRLLIVGDAAGYAEPFTGEGMAWALASATLAAPLAVAGAEHWSDAIGQRWDQRRRRTIGRRQRTCRWISRLLRRPRLCAAAVAALRVAPQLARPVLAAINRPFDGGEANQRDELLANRGFPMARLLEGPFHGNHETLNDEGACL